MKEIIKEIIQDNKYVELTYKVIDQKTDSVLVGVDFPLGYVHGVNKVLSPPVMNALEGRVVGDIIEVPVDCNEIFGPRDESLVFTDHLDNVPEEYRELGTSITMENDKGETKTFIVTKIDQEAKTLTVDGNNPLCGREVIFKLEILNIRDATLQEIEVGGAVESGPDMGKHFKDSQMVGI